MHDALTLGLDGFSYADLHDPERLTHLTLAFERELLAADPALHGRYRARLLGATLPGPAEGDLLVELSAHLSRFLGQLFGVSAELRALRAAAGRDAPLFRVKREFVAKRAFRKGSAKDRPSAADLPALSAQVAPLLEEARSRVPGDDELCLALLLEELLELERKGDAQAQGKLALLERYCVALVAAHAVPPGWVLFKLPRPLDFGHLVELRRPRGDLPEQIEGPAEHRRHREGFGLTDRRMSERQARSEIDYCLYCHQREKDSCSRGFHEKGVPDDGPYRKNPLGIPLTGCPLSEKISEFHTAGREGDALGALALICIDNPMAPGTGHRICNDCMKACIYQKQDPVDIPQTETRLLTDVLRLPWGFELWSLLTRWNPLRFERREALPYNGVDVLVVGLGPAGYTLAHHLLNEGFGVVGIDGLKIEPLPEELIGRGGVPAPIRSVAERFGAPLDERITSGFGGVSEYGITVRWDKSFLDLLHVNLARRRHFRIYGGTRFGGTLTPQDAWELGFSHVALAAGAGKPTVIRMKNNLIRGIRKASDFLMALQLTGAFKKSSLANLQVRLPALVIGGGLTAIDTATELAAYYPVQVEKLLERHEALCAGHGEATALATLDAEERQALSEMLTHARAFRAERARAQAAGEAPELSRLVRQFGGVTLVYRKGLLDSPAYRLNHEEVAKALEEGIFVAEGLSPVEAVPDEAGAVQAVRFSRQMPGEGAASWRDTGEMVELPARTVCVAAGTSPNTTLGREVEGFALDPEHGSFLPHRAERDAAGGLTLIPAAVTDDLSGEPGFFTSYRHGESPRLVSFFGDNHPSYAGSVVKAMASAKDGHPALAQVLEPEVRAAAALPLAAREERFRALCDRLDDELRPTVERVARLTPTIVEVVLRAKAAARRFQPGQFYRLQNYETLAARAGGTSLSMEGLALTGAWVDREQGLLSLIVLEMGASSRLCAQLRPGEPVVVMGPTGAPSEIPRGQDVLLFGGGLGNAVLFSIGRALRQNGCRVLYFAGYRQATDLFKREEIEACADVVVWAVDAGSGAIAARRPQDRSFVGNIVQAAVAYGRGELGTPAIPLSGIQHLLAIGSDRMMAAVQAARRAELSGLLPPQHAAIASINSPMQCMMKEICAQCLQKHRDPKTGKETVVFTCSMQDQPMDLVDWDNLRARLRMNSLQEKLSALWLGHLAAARPDGGGA